MHQNTLEGGGPVGSGNRHRPKLSSTLSRLVASVLAAMLSLAGLVAIGPAAYAATPGISISSLLNGSAISDDAVVNPGDTLTLRVRYDESLDASQPVEIGLDGAVTLDESTLERSEEHTSELQSRFDLVCRLLLEKKKKIQHT